MSMINNSVLTFIPLHWIFWNLFFVFLTCLVVRQALLYFYDRSRGDSTNLQLHNLIFYSVVLISGYYISGYYHINIWDEDDYYSERCKSADQFVLETINELNTTSLIQDDLFLNVIKGVQNNEEADKHCNYFRRSEILVLATNKADSTIFSKLLKYRKFPNVTVCKGSRLKLHFIEIKSPNNLVMADSRYYTHNKVFYKGDPATLNRIRMNSEKIFVDTILYENWTYIKTGESRYNR